jgi:hypothetical protein
MNQPIPLRPGYGEAQRLESRAWPRPSSLPRSPPCGFPIRPRSLNLPGGRLVRVRYASIATKFRDAAK